MAAGMRSVVAVAVLLAGLAAMGCTAGGPPKTTLTAEDTGTFRFPTDVPWNGRETPLRGVLTIPEGAETPAPLVVLVHGAAGVGHRQSAWGALLRGQGYATFVLDYLGPRGVGSNAREVPRSPRDVVSALRVLATHPLLDNDRVALLGFSNGASMAVGASSYHPAFDNGDIAPRAYVMLYGGCQTFAFTSSSPEAVYLYLVGSEDSLVPAHTCEWRAEEGQGLGLDVRTVVYPGAHHGFDGNRAATFTHRRFGRVTMRPDPESTRQARAEVTATLQRAFGGAGG